MRYLALATDYDGTIATHGTVDERTLDALVRLRASGRKLILVTGRQLSDLKTVFARLDLFERVVVENGALLYRPETNEEAPLCEAPPEKLVAELRARGVPVSEGRCICATWEPHQTTVLDAIRTLGLEHQVVFNKGAVMVLPPGVNKATGLKAALDQLGLSAHNVIGTGDAENDHAFLALCECAVAVANALPMVKEKADIVTERDHGAGVTEIIDELLDDDLERYDARLVRQRILLGYRQDQPVYVASSRGSILFAGPSGSGKSTAASGVIERAGECGYQYCIVDPEGDFEHFAGALSFGTAKAAPDVDELLRALASARQNVVVNLLGIPLADRPAFFAGLLPRLIEMRTQVGRPHWIVVDETHHMLPPAWERSGATMPPSLGGMIYITVHPENVSPVVLASVDMLVGIGRDPRQTLEAFAASVGESAPEWSAEALETGQGLVWPRRSQQAPFVIRTEPAKHEKRRHRRKYATGELPPERSFYFRGPEGKLNLRAQNLALFVQLAEGVDDETWLFHLRQGDYSTWFREYIKDEALAAEAARVEVDKAITAKTSRQRIRAAIESRYTAAA